MYYYKARIYSPTLGRFMQTDPIGYGDGLNMYAYVGNDPVNFSDPTGMCKPACPETVVDPVGITVSGTRPPPKINAVSGQFTGDGKGLK